MSSIPEGPSMGQMEGGKRVNLHPGVDIRHEKIQGGLYLLFDLTRGVPGDENGRWIEIDDQHVYPLEAME